jgi:DNA-binding response OmpR family regulator
LRRRAMYTSITLLRGSKLSSQACSPMYSRVISLTTKEFAVLEVLMRAAGRVLTREYIGEHAWDDNFDPLSNVIDVYIARLRKKVDGTGEEALLATVRGAGYRLAAPRP